MRPGERTRRDAGGRGAETSPPSLARTSREARADGTNLSMPQFHHPDNGSQIDHITGLNVLARTE